MFVQSCTNHGLYVARRANFGKKKERENYFAYMSKRYDNIVGISTMAGVVAGVFAARKNINEELIPKVFISIGAITLGLFSLCSLKFLMPEK